MDGGADWVCLQRSYCEHHMHDITYLVCDDGETQASVGAVARSDRAADVISTLQTNSRSHEVGGGHSKQSSRAGKWHSRLNPNRNCPILNR